MKALVVDVETTCLKLHPKELDGNPFAGVNKLCYVGLLDWKGQYHDFDIEYSDNPYGDKLKQIQEMINEHDVLVGFNIKFDLHWLDRYGLEFVEKRIWDAQLVEFLLSSQSTPYPSLDGTCTKYGFEGKLDVVKESFWNKGVDTDKIPVPILREYLQNDVQVTNKLFLHQREIVPDSLRRLISLQNQDLLVLQEIEANGMCYDVQTSQTKGDEIQETLNAMDSKLNDSSGFSGFNPGSGDHVSALLYGGFLNYSVREAFIFTYKDGRTKEKERWTDKQITFPRLVEPLKGSALKKEGYYATDQGTLSSLVYRGPTAKVAKGIVALILERALLEKLRGTYLHGLPARIVKSGWEAGMIHGQLNQCVAITGRLSSSKPNLQNMDSNIGYLFKSRNV